MFDEQGRLVVSYSSLMAFKNCPKSYEIEYEWNRESNHDKVAIKKGSLFHRYMEQAACRWEGYPFTDDPGGEMFNIAADYLERNGIPENRHSVEVPYFHEVLSGVVFRITPDLVYWKKPGVLMCRDWKTFAKAPSIDIHINDQARFYIVMLEMIYPEIECEFEFTYVRSERIGVLRGKKPAWTTQDSYFTIPYTLSPQQKEQTKLDLIMSLQALVTARQRKSYYRTGRAGFGFGACKGCIQRPLCAKEWEHGYVTEDDLEQLSKPKEFIVSNEIVAEEE